MITYTICMICGVMIMALADRIKNTTLRMFMIFLGAGIAFVYSCILQDTYRHSKEEKRNNPALYIKSYTTNVTITTNYTKIK